MEALPRARELSGLRPPADSTVAGDGWTTSVLTGTASQLHLRDLPWRRGAWLLRPDQPALVLGSTQPESDVDPEGLARLGLGSARRRSGGGAVHVSDDCVWIDVTIGRDDPLWLDDVSASSSWLGRAWAEVLESLGLGSFRVHEGAMVHHPLERTVCFAGLAPGEVTDASGAKVVGISQRRGRDGARFQCAVHLRWRPQAFAGALADPSARDGVAALPVRALIEASAPGRFVESGGHEALLARLVACLPMTA